MFLISEMQGCPKNQNFRPPWPIPTVVVILGLLSNCMAIGAFLAFSVCNFFFGTPCIYCIVVYESIGNSVRFLHLIMLVEAAEGLRRRSLVVSLGSRNERLVFFKNMQSSLCPTWGGVWQWVWAPDQQGHICYWRQRPTILVASWRLKTSLFPHCFSIFLFVWEFNTLVAVK